MTYEDINDVLKLRVISKKELAQKRPPVSGRPIFKSY